VKTYFTTSNNNNRRNNKYVITADDLLLLFFYTFSRLFFTSNFAVFLWRRKNIFAPEQGVA